MTVLSTLSSTFYRYAAKPYYFRRDPEDVHDSVTRIGEFLGRHGATRFATSVALAHADPRLELRVCGIDFPNPVGLAAGFDKDARLVDIMPSVGFGFMEVGSVTGQPCEGNPKPRLWRLPDSQALAVHYGLKNDGCAAISRRLAGRKFGAPVGTSIAMTNCAENADVEAGIADYAKAFGAFTDIGSYYTVNISCPNAFGGQPFTAPDRLDRLLSRLDGIFTRKPVFLKLSPDLDASEIDAIIEVAMRHRVRGFVCSNLTKDRENDRLVDAAIPRRGGFSGKAVGAMADAQIAYVYRKTEGKYAIIGCGGIFTAEDAYRKIRLGASLVQMITGMIFEGPQVVGDINRGLVRLLDRDGLDTIADARGDDVGW
ncbi:MAG TPA: quinone-dependent dihydroorotate dehydrogenase [Candidatus Eisenbacteria bacterium]|nr:quinone-dependent dihydroorotate dehydrogenase [Candidatus Eisenbacteria bacterium]